MSSEQAGAGLDRILVVGPTGVGKSYAASKLAVLFHKPLVNLDRLMLDAQSQPKPKEQFVAEAEEYFGRDELAGGWVVDGTYRSLRHITWDNADVIGYIRPGLPRNIALVALRAVRHDIAGGNSDLPFSQQLRRLFNTRPYDLEKLDATTNEYEQVGKLVVRCASSDALVSEIGAHAQQPIE